MSEPSPVQTKKFNEFLQSSSAGQVHALLRVAISAANLRSEDLGVYWGITVCPDKDSLARLNVSNRVLLDVRRTGSVDIFLLDRTMRFNRLPMSLKLYEGFDSLPGSAILEASSYEEATTALGNRAVQKYFRQHSLAEWRKLPNPKWHNPLANSLLL